ncbi:hypothetical protein EAG_13663 [Camponotus floridanus]|uniref:Uncharacterized protein n=1 Tax=Camponotus floridanus TaxID=104421 RepID=E2A3Y6_CAMFO|nr:hypothetical protein EAG_13663 [Camponotus floridanus]
MSDDIELNVDTLEPDEEEIEKQVCEEEYSEQRIPMRKPATLVQYWVNTGHQPYNALLDENDLSEAGSSLSEKEIILSLSSVSTIINEGNKQKYKNESSCSSVNTAAYILSNANITNKVDTIAIRQSAKCGKNINSKNICNKDVKEKVTSDNKIQCMQNENAKVTCVIDNDNVNTNIPDIELYSVSKDVASKICDQPVTNKVTSDNTIETNMYLQNYKQIDKNVLNTNQRSLDTEITDDTVWQFNKTSKQLTENDEDNASNHQDKTLGKDNSYEEKESENIAQEVTTKDKNLIPFYHHNNSDKQDDILFSECNNANIFVRNETCKQDSASLNMNPVVLLERNTSFEQHKSKPAENNYIMEQSKCHCEGLMRIDKFCSILRISSYPDTTPVVENPTYVILAKDNLISIA